MPKKIPWKKLDSRVVYRNKWITVREDGVICPDGTKSIYGVIETRPSVYIVPLTDQNEIYLVEQYRYPTKIFSWEIPAGGSEGENFLIAAKRELWEETGFRARRWMRMGKFQSWNGCSSEWGYMFIARGLSQTGTNKQKEEGISRMKKVPFTEIMRMIVRGELTDSASIVALTKAALMTGIFKK